MIPKDRAKKALLLILLAVAVYIWWGNLELFIPSETESYENPYVIGKPHQIQESNEKLAYRKPKVNPFGRPNAKPPDPKPTPKSPVQNPVITPGTIYRLSGVLSRGGSSQAVLLAPQERSLVLAINDSLDGWWLEEVSSNYVIFRQGKLRDTLYLSDGNL